MADAWPATLPEFVLVDGFAEGMADGRLISEMETGPAKMRRRSSAMPRPLQQRMIMDDDQWADLMVFVSDTLIGGVLPFEFDHPDGSGPLLLRFRESLPSRVPHNGIDTWIVSLDLEVLP